MTAMKKLVLHFYETVKDNQSSSTYVSEEAKNHVGNQDCPAAEPEEEQKENL